jgi:phenylalanyl-tRNA synthetase alpha chain
VADVPDLAPLTERALAAAAAADTLTTLDDVRVEFLGKKSELSQTQRLMGGLDNDGKRALGQAINAFKRDVEAGLAERHTALEAVELAARLASERIDVTLPAQLVPAGRPHLLTQVSDEICDVLIGLGYTISDGPEAESGAFAFDLMNIPMGHPARQEMDTVYVDKDTDVVLRPHTSSVQARTMISQQPPIAIACPGRVFRSDTFDATHSPYFHQVEGLLIDVDVTMADLRGTLLTFARSLLGDEVGVRLRPSMFPFTEPSAEVDVSCTFCTSASGTADSSCRVCSGTGWIEILGSGMVDPAVLEACGIDSEVYSGFAFGVGVERIAMLRHGVSDIRDFWSGDARFAARF